MRSVAPARSTAPSADSSSRRVQLAAARVGREPLVGEEHSKGRRRQDDELPPHGGPVDGVRPEERGRPGGSDQSHVDAADAASTSSDRWAAKRCARRGANSANSSIASAPTTRTISGRTERHDMPPAGITAHHRLGGRVDHVDQPGGEHADDQRGHEERDHHRSLDPVEVTHRLPALAKRSQEHLLQHPQEERGQDHHPHQADHHEHRIDGERADEDLDVGHELGEARQAEAGERRDHGRETHGPHAGREPAELVHLVRARARVDRAADQEESTGDEPMADHAERRRRRARCVARPRRPAAGRRPRRCRARPGPCGRCSCRR